MSVRDAIEAEHRRIADQIVDLRQSFAGIVDAAELTSTDDEHDPEGATIAYERAQVSALLRQAEEDLAALDLALERVDNGTAQTLRGLRGNIALERLLALPTTRFCTAARADPRAHLNCVTPVCHAANMRSIEVPELADLEGLGADKLEVMLVECEAVRRRAEAMIAEIVGVAERTTAYVEDGHASVSGWAKAACNWSSGETKAVVQTARLFHAVPEARSAAHAGSLGSAQSRLLARLFANPRCADQLPSSGELLIGHAQGLWFDEFAVVVRRWEALADADGAHAAHERAHSGRDAHVSIVDQRVHLDAQGGVAAGAAMTEVFDRFCDTEFHADWDNGVAKWGEQMNPTLLERTSAQRRFDALLAIFNAAAASGVAGTFDPLVNILIDQVTFEHHLAKMAGADVEPLDPATVNDRRCETSTGHQLDPADVLAAALVGHVRRVVLDSAGVVIDLGRRSRLFTGGARDAVLLGDRWCMWPGCDLRSGRCQTDHTTAWSTDGPTRPDNGAPACARHNRWKQHGYRTWRDPTGHWHTYRPDGTEIGRALGAAAV